MPPGVRGTQGHREGGGLGGEGCREGGPDRAAGGGGGGGRQGGGRPQEQTREGAIHILIDFTESNHIIF